MNKKMFTKLFALVLAVCAVLSLAIISSSAADEATGTWNLVTDASTLKYGDKVVIVSATSNVAMSTNQKSNNRGQTTVTKSSDKSTVAWTATDVQVLTIEDGKIAGTFAFNTGSGYLYAASSSSNHLKTEKTLSNNSSWKITIASSGVATVKAQGTNTRNWMRYNSQSSLFACYSSGQADIVLYRYEEAGATDCEHASQTTTTVDSTCTVAGSITVTCDDCGAVISKKNLDTLPHVYEDSKCVECGKAEPIFYPTVSELKTGDVVVIMADFYKRALSTTKVATYYNKGFDYTDGFNNVTDNELFIVTVNDDGTYSFTSKTGKSIAMAASKSSLNETGANKKWKLEAKAGADGVFYVKNVGRNNYLEWYAAKDNWSTYSTSKLDEQFEITFGLVESSPFKKASVKLGTDLSMLYTVSVPTGTPSMTFNFNGETVTVTEYTTNEDGTYTFEFAGIAPQQMALNIKATLNVDGKAVATFDNYSVEKNLNNIKNAEGASEALVALVNSVLIYGNASENYLDNTAGVDASGLKNDVAENETEYTLANAETFGFTAAGVNFDAANKIYVKFFVEGEFTLTVNGVAVKVEATEDGKYKVYTDALTAKQFADTYEFVIEANGEKAVLTYSVNAYAAAMQNDDAMGELAAALYAYGVNAKAYVA